MRPELRRLNRDLRMVKVYMPVKTELLQDLLLRPWLTSHQGLREKMFGKVDIYNTIYYIEIYVILFC